MSVLLRKRYPFLAPSIDVDHLIIGCGVVGLAVGERLVKAFDGRTTFLVERNGQCGQETSSRNSEVIHSGIYYPLNSLKTALCIQGRNLLYERCKQDGIPHQKTGKFIIATKKDQMSYLSSLAKKAEQLEGGVRLEWWEPARVREQEPDVSKDIVGALWSPDTGIVDSHGLMASIERNLEDSESGELVYGTRVVRLDSAEGRQGGWVVQTVTDDGNGKELERSAVYAKCVVNAAGLNAQHIVNQILPPEKHRRLYYAKGSYFSYRGPGVSSVRHLLYPCPDPSSLAGLGTHLTMNLDNEIRFGPDVEWLKSPQNAEDEDEMDFWTKHLQVSEENLEAAIESVKQFLPDVDPAGFQPDYVGIRPKLSGPGQAASDFVIEHTAPGFISLLGIESPGLTSALAIAERVEDVIRREVWGLGKGKGRRVSEGGHSSLDGWA